MVRSANRIREVRLYEYGFGEKKTTPAFVAACDRLICSEILRQVSPVKADSAAPRRAAQGNSRVSVGDIEELVKNQLLRRYAMKGAHH